MKKLLFSTLSLLVLTVFFLSSQTSCKKDTITNTVTKTDTIFKCVYNVQGLWAGTYSVSTIPLQGQLFAAFTIYPDGTLMYKSKGGDGNFYYSKGTWVLSPSNILSGTMITFPNASFLPVTQSFTMTFSNTGTLTNASWNDTINPNGPALSGAFQSLAKIN